MFVVRELISKPFRDRPLQEQMQLVTKGCPPCAIEELWEDVDDEKGLIRAREVVSRRADWITSCPVSQRLFCWPCLLLCETDTEWSKYGCTDFRSLPEKAHEHETSVEHLQALLDLKAFRSKHLKQPKSPENVPSVRELQLGQREGLGLLVDALVTSLGVHPRPSYLSYDYDGQVDPKDLGTFLETLRAFSPLNPHLSWAARFLEAVPLALRHVVDAVAEVMKAAVRLELESAPHVSILLSEHSRGSALSLISTVLSFTREGATAERFVGFVSMPRDRTASAVLGHVSRVLDEFGVRDKLLAYSLDGGAVPSGQLREFTNTMLGTHRAVFFVPWHGHCLEDCLMQSLRGIPEVDEFWRGMVGLRRFFEKRVGADRRPSFLSGHIVAVAHEFRHPLAKFLSSIVNSPLAWAPDDVSCALGCIHFLQQFRNLFLLYFLTQVFDAFRPLLAVPQPEMMFDPALAGGVAVHLEQVRAAGFEQMLAGASLFASRTPDAPPSAGELDRDRFSAVFDQVMSGLLGPLQYRLADLRRLNFVSIVLKRPVLDLESKCIWYIAQSHKGIAVDPLRVELDVTRENLRLWADEYKDFDFNSVAGLFRFLLKTGTGRALPNVFRLAELCFSLPIYQPADEISKYRVVQEWGEYKENVIKPGDKSMMAVELGLLRELAQRDTFYDAVFDVFTSRYDMKPFWTSDPEN